MAKLSDFDELTSFDLANDALWAVEGFAPDPSAAGTDRWMSGENFLISLTGDLNVQTYTTLDAALAVISTNTARLLIPASLTVANTQTVPENVTLVWTGQGLISVNATKTLTINGPIEAPSRHIFTGSGTVVLGRNIGKVPVQWFNVKGDARHVDDAATSGTSLTSATAAFTSADVGKTVVIKGAGTSGVPHITTIASVTNSTTAVLTATAPTSVSAKRLIIGTDDSAAMQKAVTAATGKNLYFSEQPSRGYLVKMTATGGGAVSIPSNTTLMGDGPGSVIYVIGSNGASIGDTDNKAAFGIADGTKKVLIKGLRFVGENGPYTEPEQNQSNVIWLPGSTLGTTDVMITECYFDDLFGFSVHCAGENAHRVHVTHCAFKNNANGLNVNSDYSIQAYNTFDHCEGIETSSAYALISHNILNDCGLDSHSSVAISVGGRTSIGSYGLGTIVSHNEIIASRSGGIVLSDGFVEGQVVNNYVYKSWGVGIQQIQTSGNDIFGNIIADNRVISCGRSGFGSPFGILTSNGTDTQVKNNRVIDRAITNYATTYAIFDTATRTHIDGNTASGTTKDIALNGTDTQFGQNNIYDRTKVECTGTLVSPVFRGYKFLPDNTATGIVDIALPTLTASSGLISYRIYEGVGGDVQSRSGLVRWNACNKAGVYSSEIPIINEGAAVGSGTLTATWSIVSGTNKITIKVTADTSLFGGTKIEYAIQHESPQGMTIL